LEKYALAEERVGEARLAQDAQIQQRFLAGWTTTLNTNLQFATRARRAVENARLSLDATKAKAKNTGRGFNPDDEHVSEEMRAEIERKEDEFVGQTEEAVGVMKNVGLRHAGGGVCFFLCLSGCGCADGFEQHRSSIPLSHSAISRT
jgi:hypothetical protein